jgi:excisionase family DNA binding protein
MRTVREVLLTAKEVSELLKVPEKTIRNWAYQRRIPFLKVGRLLRFHPHEIESWLGRFENSGQCTGTSAWKNATKIQLM